MQQGVLGAMVYHGLEKKQMIVVYVVAMTLALVVITWQTVVSGMMHAVYVMATANATAVMVSSGAGKNLMHAMYAAVIIVLVQDVMAFYSLQLSMIRFLICLFLLTYSLVRCMQWYQSMPWLRPCSL